jgi:hypothetical protein
MTLFGWLAGAQVRTSSIVANTRFLAFAALIGGLTFALTPQAHAGSTIHIGSGAGTDCDIPDAGCKVYGTEVNAFTTVLSLYQNSGGASTASTPVLLIMAVPNDTLAGIFTGLGASQIVSASFYNNYDPLNPGSGTSITSSFGATLANGQILPGFAGLMTSGDIYGFLGLTGNNSNSFTNLAAADLALFNLAVSNFGIYVYGLNTSLFSGQDLIDVEIEGVTQGTFGVGYAIAGSKQYDTPFTESSVDGPGEVPEPLTIALFGFGLAGFGMMRRKLAA